MNAGGRNDGGHPGKVHCRDAQGGTRRGDCSALGRRRRSQKLETSPKETNGDCDRQDRKADFETDRHRPAISEHRDEMHRPDTDPCRDGGDDKPMTPPDLDAGRGAGKDREKTNIAENADERGDQDQPKIMLVDDAFEDIKHQ